MKRVLMITLVAILVLIGLIGFKIFTLTDLRGITQPYQTLAVGSLTRKYRVHLPKDYDQAKVYPLVIALHGYRIGSKSFELYTGLSNLADREKFIIVYPEGIDQSWNGKFCCGTAKRDEIDDLGFLRQLTDKIGTDYSVNSNSVYILGYSNGGILAQIAIEEFPQTFKGASIIMSGAGSSRRKLKFTQANTPLLIINGTNDEYIPVRPSDKTGEGFNFIPVTETIRTWENQYKCQPLQTDNTKDYRWQTYSCQQAQLLTYRYKSQSHLWPEWRLSHPFTSTSSSAELIWQFFNSL